MTLTLQKIGDIAVPHSERDREAWGALVNEALYTVRLQTLDTRTLQQNRALHLWCTQIAQTLNAQRLYLTGVFGSPIEWSMELVKTQIVKATMRKVFDKTSTTQLGRKEIDALIDYITVALARKGVEIPPFPSRELWSRES